MVCAQKFLYREAMRLDGDTCELAGWSDLNVAYTSYVAVQPHRFPVQDLMYTNHKIEATCSSIIVYVVQVLQCYPVDGRAEKGDCVVCPHLGGFSIVVWVSHWLAPQVQRSLQRCQRDDTACGHTTQRN